MVFEHELAHVRQRHWIDLLVAQLFCTLNWFNPQSWIYLKLVKQNHEFLADRAVLQKGNSVAVYRAALINHTLGIPVFTFASTFAKSDKLKRIHMMDKSASSPFNKVAVLITFPALATVLWAFAKTEYTIKPANTIANHVVSSTVGEDTTIAQPQQHTFIRIEKEDLPSKKKVNSGKKKPAVHKVKETNAPVSISGKVDKQSDIIIKQEPKDGVSILGGLEIKPQPLFILDGEEISSMIGIKTEDVQSIHVLKDASAIALYGEKGKNGVVVISSKK
jgi:TonB-dependent SusC/RagA subfamily outer membrane receptor